MINHLRIQGFFNLSVVKFILFMNFIIWIYYFYAPPCSCVEAFLTTWCIEEVVLVMINFILLNSI